MARGWGDELREQGRGIVGALLVVGTTFLYTMETWWWGWTLPTTHLLVYSLVGLAVVLAITRQISFRESENGGESNRESGAAGSGNPIRETLTDFAELVLQSFVAAYVVLLTFGVVDIGDPLPIIARLGLVEVVPLGFGAALANELLTGNKQTGQRTVTQRIAVHSLGAVFVAGGISPTQEIELLTVYMGRIRMPVLVVLSVLIAYLVLYELDLAGQDRRLRGRKQHWQVGHAVLAYAVAVAVGTGLLAAFGHFDGTPLPVMVQMIVIVSFPSAIGASAAQVVIG
jgi:putative integral membrane protein (TIGR02587 family)